MDTTPRFVAVVKVSLIDGHKITDGSNGTWYVVAVVKVSLIDGHPWNWARGAEVGGVAVVKVSLIDGHQNPAVKIGRVAQRGCR